MPWAGRRPALPGRGKTGHTFIASTLAMNVLLVNISAGKMGIKPMGSTLADVITAAIHIQFNTRFWVAPLSHPKASFSDVN